MKDWHVCLGSFVVRAWKPLGGRFVQFRCPGLIGALEPHEYVIQIPGLSHLLAVNMDLKSHRWLPSNYLPSNNQYVATRPAHVGARLAIRFASFGPLMLIPPVHFLLVLLGGTHHQAA